MPAVPTRAALGLCLMLGAGPSWAGAPRSVGEPVADAFLARVDAYEAAAARLKDSQYTFYKQNYVRGKMLPESRSQVKFRPPHDVYMKFEGPVSPGREVLFSKGWNEDRIRVNVGAVVPNLNLDPHGSLALRDSRKSILMVGFPNTVPLFTNDADLYLGGGAPMPTVTDLGTETVYGSAAHCYRIELPKDKEPRYYAREVKACFDLATDLVSRVEVSDLEDGALRLVEAYGFEKIRVDTGLSDADFDPENAAYGF